MMNRYFSVLDDYLIVVSTIHFLRSDFLQVLDTKVNKLRDLFRLEIPVFSFTNRPRTHPQSPDGSLCSLEKLYHLYERQNHQHHQYTGICNRFCITGHIHFSHITHYIVNIEFGLFLLKTCDNHGQDR